VARQRHRNVDEARAADHGVLLLHDYGLVAFERIQVEADGCLEHERGLDVQEAHGRTRSARDADRLARLVGRRRFVDAERIEHGSGRRARLDDCERAAVRAELAEETSCEDLAVAEANGDVRTGELQPRNGAGGAAAGRAADARGIGVDREGERLAGIEVGERSGDAVVAVVVRGRERALARIARRCEPGLAAPLLGSKHFATTSPAMPSGS
jgi:hypothetical protein